MNGRKNGKISAISLDTFEDLKNPPIRRIG